MSQGVTTATGTTTSNGGPDLIAYQNYFSFTPMNNNDSTEKRKAMIQSCTHCQKVKRFKVELYSCVSNLYFFFNKKRLI